MAKKSPSSKLSLSSKKAKAKPLPARPTPARDGDEEPAPPPLGAGEQQRVLDIFSRAFGEELTSSDFESVVQGIKRALFKRDFGAAFGREDYLACYAARWSPTRALCYASIFRGPMKGYFEDLARVRENGRLKGVNGNGEGTASLKDDKNEALKMVSIGGGAAELVAFAALLASLGPTTGSIALLDSGPWSTKVQRLNTTITTPPALSKYASEAAKATNKALLPPSALQTTILQQDVLGLEKSEIAEILGRNPVVVTVFFTLNELYTSGGMKKTTSFLLKLTDCVPEGSFLLVVDSPGSYSEAAVGKESKKYPMQWLLDHTLLETENPRWEKLESDDSVWFRLSDSLVYPIPLENMRYQVHLYQAKELAPSTAK